MKASLQEKLIRFLGYAAVVAIVMLCGIFGVSKLDM